MNGSSTIESGSAIPFGLVVEDWKPVAPGQQPPPGSRVRGEFAFEPVYGFGGNLFSETEPQNQQKLPPPSGCAKFVDQLLARVNRIGISLTQRAVGASMALDARDNLATQAGNNGLDYSGFKPELIAGGQNGWAMVHIQGIAGSLLAGYQSRVDQQFREDRAQFELGMQYKRAGRTTIPYSGNSEYPLDKYLAEKQAEKTDDEYAVSATAILQAKINGRKTFIGAQADLANLLCDNLFNPPVPR